MNMQQIKEKAILLGVKPGKKRKADLIRDIQSAEGNFPCFGSAVDYCDQALCCWRQDCLAGQPKTPTSVTKGRKTIKRPPKKSTKKGRASS